MKFDALVENILNPNSYNQILEKLGFTGLSKKYFSFVKSAKIGEIKLRGVGLDARSAYQISNQFCPTGKGKKDEFHVWHFKKINSNEKCSSVGFSPYKNSFAILYLNPNTNLEELYELIF